MTNLLALMTPDSFIPAVCRQMACPTTAITLGFRKHLVFGGGFPTSATLCIPRLFLVAVTAAVAFCRATCSLVSVY